MTSEQKQWQAESDANTLVEAKRIQEDTKRLAAATKAAEKLQKDLNEQTAALKDVISQIYSKKD